MVSRWGKMLRVGSGTLISHSVCDTCEYDGLSIQENERENDSCTVADCQDVYTSPYIFRYQNQQ